MTLTDTYPLLVASLLIYMQRHALISDILYSISVGKWSQHFAVGWDKKPANPAPAGGHWAYLQRHHAVFIYAVQPDEHLIHLSVCVYERKGEREGKGQDKSQRRLLQILHN